MTRTNWGLMISGKELSAEKNSRKKLYISQKILSKDLPEYIDAGWEKAKDFKNPKYVGITKEKPVGDQFEDRVWMLFANMGFSVLNVGKDFSMAYDFRDDDQRERISVMAVDDETILIVSCHASETMIEYSFAEEIEAFSGKISGLRGFKTIPWA